MGKHTIRYYVPNTPHPPGWIHLNGNNFGRYDQPGQQIHVQHFFELRNVGVYKRRFAKVATHGVDDMPSSLVPLTD